MNKEEFLEKLCELVKGKPYQFNDDGITVKVYRNMERPANIDGIVCYFSAQVFLGNRDWEQADSLSMSMKNFGDTLKSHCYDTAKEIEQLVKDYGLSRED